MKGLILFCVLLMNSFTWGAEILHIEGVVSIVNRKNSSRIYVNIEGTSNKFPICDQGEYVAQIQELEKVKVKISGPWKFANSAKTRCINIKSLDILRMPDGGQPQIGVLKKEESGFYLLDDKNGKLMLKNIPEPVQQYVDKRVAIETKQDSSVINPEDIHSYSVIHLVPVY